MAQSIMGNKKNAASSSGAPIKHPPKVVEIHSAGLPILPHGVSPLRTSTPQKDSQDDKSRVKRAHSAFDLNSSIQE